jgi:hypothetical protein
MKILLLIVLSFNVLGQTTESIETVISDDLKVDRRISFSKHFKDQASERKNNNTTNNHIPAKKNIFLNKKRKISESESEIKRKANVPNTLTNLVKYPQENSVFNDLGVFEGSTLEIKIMENMIGYGESKRSVSGEVMSGNLKGFVVLGNVSMDPKTKELLVDFTKIRQKDGNKMHKFRAESRLKGRHETKLWTYFWATVAANAVGGFAEGAKDREYTIVGSKSLVSPENMLKNSVARAGNAGAEIFINELKKYPEFTVVIGPTITNAVISKAPDSIN